MKAIRSRLTINEAGHGETPIFYAARLQRLKTLDLLIDEGVDPTIADSKGRDAIDIARARGLSKDLIDRLVELGRSSPRS